MDPILIIAIVVILALVGVAAYLYTQKQRTERLAGRFGPEYQRTAEDVGDRRQTEQELEAREKRVQQLHIRALSTDEQARYAERWRTVQARFVDDPSGSIGEADELVQEVMQARGYPVGDFEQRAADVSVDHAGVVEHYRAAHAIAERHADGGADTEALRQAVVHYRALFEDLLEDQPAETAEARQ